MKFPVETWHPLSGWYVMGAETPMEAAPDLLRAMKDAPNPWQVLGTQEARRILADLWQLAEEGNQDARTAFDSLHACLEPRRPRKRGKKPDLGKRRALALAKQTLDWYERAILEGFNQKPDAFVRYLENRLENRSGLEESVDTDRTDPFTPYEFTPEDTPEEREFLEELPPRSVVLIVSHLSNRGILLEERKLLLEPPPTGGKAQALARDRAARYLQAVCDALPDLSTDPYFAALRHLVEKRRETKPTRRKQAMDTARKRRRRAK